MWGRRARDVADARTWDLGNPELRNCWVAAGRFNVSGVGLGADDRVLCPFPLVNMAGIGGMLVPWLVTGYRLVLHQPFDLPTFLALPDRVPSYGARRTKWQAETGGFVA